MNLYSFIVPYFAIALGWLRALSKGGAQG